MRRLRAGIGAGLLLAGLALAVAPGRAEAATLAKVGWWSRTNDGTLPVTPPAPPTVPEGGLLVGGAPDGATAIAALHVDLTEGETAPVLTLEVAEDGDVGGATAVLAACLTGSAWEATSNGLWTLKPFPACDQGSVSGVRSDDGATWTFALAPLESDRIVDVVLVPGVLDDLPPGANGSTFQLSFEAPTGEALATSAGDTTPTIPLPDVGSGGPSTDPTTFDEPTLGGDLGLPPVDTFTPALPESDQGLTATAPLVQRRTDPFATQPIAEVEDHKLLGAVVLLLCGGALLWSAQLPVPEVRRLGPMASAATRSGPRSATAVEPAPVVGGLGRFARIRSGDRAPRL